MSLVPWTEKYRPKRVDEVIGNPDAKRKFVAWLNSWIRGKPAKKAALLYGPPGSGKTSIVHAAAYQFGWELIETNASDVRSSAALRRRVFSAATQGSIFGARSKIILLDEVDGVNPREDHGGLRTILELIEISQYPIVLTANNPWDPRLRELRSLCELIEFRRLKKREVMKVLAEICRREGVDCDRAVLSAIASNARGDLRAAINDLQSLAMGRKRISLEDLNILGLRAEQATMFEIVRSILTARRPEQALGVLRLPSLDYEMLLQWLNENIIFQYSPSLKAISDGYDALSWADIFLARMRRRQKWVLLPYALQLMTAGVASAREKPPFKFVKYSFPEKLRRLSSLRNKRENMKRVLTTISQKLHVSTRVALLEVIPYIKIIYENDTSNAKNILNSLGISEREFKAAFY